MPAENTEIYAHWKPANDTPYTVYYYKENPDMEGEYLYEGKQRYRGTTDSTVSPEPKTLTKMIEEETTDPDTGEKKTVSKTVTDERYAMPKKAEVKILADGSAVLRYYYDLKRSKTTFKTGEHGTSADVVLTTKYGSDIRVPETAASGFELTGWKNTATGEVITTDEIAAKNGSIGKADGNNVTYEAQWQEREDITYRVEYYVQQPSGSYTVQAINYGQGRVGAKIKDSDVRTATVTMVSDADGGKEITGSAAELFIVVEEGVNVLEYECMTMDGQVVDEEHPAVIKADGSTVVKVKYKRKSWTVKLQGKDENDTSGVYTDYTVCHGGKLALPYPQKEGYTFLGYQDEKGKKVEVNPETGFAVVTVTEDSTYTSMGWEANTYTAEYNAGEGTFEDGTSRKEQTFTYDEEQALQAAPQREGFVFKGWKDEKTETIYEAGANAKNLTGEKDGKVELTAEWELKGYDVTYDLSGGSMEANVNPATYAIRDEERVLAAPTRAGYTFGGWYNGSERVMSLPGGNTGDLVLTARWTAKEGIYYTVNHYKQNADGKGNTLAEQELVSANAGESVTPGTKAYEGFDAPEAKTVTVEADGTTEIDYIYERHQHDVSLDLAGGSSSDPEKQTMYYGENMTFAIPQKDGAVFAGWKADGEILTKATVPDKDLSLTAEWETAEAGCVINHYLMDTSGEYTILADREVMTGKAGDSLDAEPKTYQGFTSPEKKSVTLAAGETKTVDLQYKREKHEVTWQLNGGEAVNDYTTGSVYYEAAILAPKPVKNHYTYRWDQLPAGVMGTEDVTGEVVWTPESCNVLFDATGGTMDGAVEKTVTCGETYGELPTAQKKHAELIGWYDAPEGGNKVEGTDIVSTSGSQILYARWKYVSAEIKYVGIEQSDTNDNPTSYEVGRETKIKAPKREGCLFTGWTTEENATPQKTYVISADRTETVTLVANWETVTYTLSLYSFSGLYMVKNLAYGADLSIIPLPTNSGYKLNGWKDVQTGELLEKLPGTMPASDLTLVSQWEQQKYSLIVENPYDSEMEAVTWLLGDNSFALQPPTKNRTGYDFAGWYTDKDYKEENKIERMKPVPYNVSVYAKWVPRTYPVVLYFSGGTTADGEESSETMTFTYDEAKELRSEKEFTRNGYTFAGWAKQAESKTEDLADGTMIGEGNNLSTGGDDIVNLFAVWTPITYKITYEFATVGAQAENGTNNPVSYSIESEDAVLKEPLGIKSGEAYEFLGWFDNAEGKGEPIRSLKLKGEYGNKTVYAKWANAGTFSIRLKSSSSATPTGDGTSVFTVSRTMPSGIAVSTDTQRVYYRTVNGTAIGDTAENGSNFYHVGGPNTFAEFSDKRCISMEDNKEKPGTMQSNGSASIDFTVKNENASARYYGKVKATDEHGPNGKVYGYYANLYNLSGTPTRYYTAEIYKLKSTEGNVTGAYGTREATRTMTMPSNKLIGTSVYSGYRHEYVFPEKFTFITNHEPGKTDRTWILLKDLIEDKNKENYLRQAGTKPSIQITDLPFYSNDHETQMWTYLGYADGTEEGLFNFPDNGYEKEQNGHFRSNDWYAITWDKYDKAGVKLWGNKMDGGHADLTKCIMSLQTQDTSGPQQVGIAPAALTEYKKGDTVKFSVVYDELISDYSNISVNTSAFSTYMPLTNVTCTGGKGTNVLTFTGTATKDFANTTWGSTGTNNEMIELTNVVNGTVKDIKGNQ